MKKVTFDTETFSSGAQVSPKNCNGIIFINKGDVDAFIGELPLLSGEKETSFLGNTGEVILNNFPLKFKSGTAGTNPLVVVIRKFTDDIPIDEECKYKRS